MGSLVNLPPFLGPNNEIPSDSDVLSAILRLPQAAINSFFGGSGGPSSTPRPGVFGGTDFGAIGRYFGSLPASASYLLNAMKGYTGADDRPITGMDPASIRSGLMQLGADPATIVARRGLDPRARLMVAQMFKVPLPSGGNSPRKSVVSGNEYADISPDSGY